MIILKKDSPITTSSFPFNPKSPHNSPAQAKTSPPSTVVHP